MSSTSAAAAAAAAATGDGRAARDCGSSISRARLLKVTVALGCACGFVLSRRLWLSSWRDYPHAPVADFLSPPAYPLDLLWLGALFLLLALVAVSARPLRYVAAFLALALPLALWDQSRWQPWFYQYFFMLAALALYPWGGGGRDGGDDGPAEDRRAAALNACRVIVASVYFWGGVQKLNPGFEEMMLFLLARQLPASLAESIPLHATLVVPAVEIFVGVGLLIRRLRNAAVVLAVTTHAVILLLLVPSGTNTVVWPWNVAAAASVVILFWGAGGVGPAVEVLAGGRRPFKLLVTLLFAVMPALNFVGLWDSYLSAALYTGATKEAFIRFADPVRARLPARARRAVVREEGGGYVLHVNRWSQTELNVPAYPEERIYRRAARAVCAHADAPGDVTIELRERSGWRGGAARTRTLDCSSLDR